MNTINLRKGLPTALLGLLILVTPLCQAQLINDTCETEFTKYRVSTKSCTKLIHFTGSRIFIPDHVFALNPQEVDSVDIYYRELRTPLDMVIHNIPMTVSLVGKQFHLESNGMFEIWAKAENDTIEIHEDRSIEVRLAISPEDIDVRMEGFQFDEGSQMWESYTDRLKYQAVNRNDDDLWGSTPVQNQFWEEEEDPEWTRKDSIRKVAFQAMEIFDFGLYNYDKIIDGETFIPVNASFISMLNVSLKSTVYIVYDDINSVFQYGPTHWEKDFSIIKDKSYKLFTIDEVGKISSLLDFPKLAEINGKEHTFKLKEESKVPESRNELAKLTGIR